MLRQQTERVFVKGRIMKLSELIAALPAKGISGNLDIDVSGIVHDSRRVRPGDIFVAIKGLNVDGHDYVPEAIARGAMAVVAEREPPLVPPRSPYFPFVIVPNSRQALAFLSAAFYGFPARKLRMVGVTGTDGKTTTVNLIRAILMAAGHEVGVISTVEAIIGRKHMDTGLHTTTPDAPDVQRYLAQMVEARAEYAVLEATSHGLHQYRLNSCDFDVAVLTNITHEHLDYHKTYENYREAKAQLFRELAPSFRKPETPKVAILNADDPSFPYFVGIPADVRLSYGINTHADVIAEDILHSPSGTSFTATIRRGRFAVETSLLGAFNVYNILAAIAVGVSQHIPFEAMQEGIRSFKSVVGRMERIDLGQDFTVIIDFAHTPNALENALELARTLTPGKLISVFGCAGLRDRAKRPVMGKIAGRLADRVVITAEDPRTEDLSEIMAQIAVGCEQAGRQEGWDYWRIGDRGEAIRFALRLAEPGDLVIITGKGHERSMCFGETEYPWSDHAAVTNSLALLPHTGS